jgi:threonyl-tRNA synthetase
MPSVAAMSANTKSGNFDLVEQAVKAGTASAEVSAAFEEWADLQRQVQALGNPETYYLKAMNCPHHHRIFAAEPKSYRDLPLRLAEYGCCYL